ncbi:MAG: MmcQ/YjbR family DNA-binding protein [Alistipes sp.]|nr:MmcQ/YjbR family DNA-binding protein [Alistipes sp.]
MDPFEVRAFALSLPEAEECWPFDDQTPVYKVAGKIFLLADVQSTHTLNLKCDPDQALELRERYAEVTPGWHMNKRHWNTVRIDGDLPAALIRRWIADSYRLVVEGLPAARRKELLEACKGLI